ncbi:hypothetical protein Ddye_008564 [Dipteronia dyeriana]|uniref:Carbohydrate kinase PfkB domain-containing protein n=1 Tax=Dipteronia dyeriana TaxID=168575 RepID=A0AAE0CLG1_9ROSI|nr:hypothetical protein Ddye_008564 [Dipteronia dyeriana]
MEVEEVQKKCCVVVSHGKEECELYLIDGEMMKILPFSANQVDPTGAGDNFLGGFVAGLVQGLHVPDVALLGNLQVCDIYSFNGLWTVEESVTILVDYKVFYGQWRESIKAFSFRGDSNWLGFSNSSDRNVLGGWSDSGSIFVADVSAKEGERTH